MNLIKLICDEFYIFVKLVFLFVQSLETFLEY